MISRRMTFAALLALTTSGCAAEVEDFMPPKQVGFTVRGESFKQAYSAAAAAALQTGFQIFTSDSNGGTFYATKGNGYTGMTELNFQLIRGRPIQGSVSIKSSDTNTVTNEFMSAFEGRANIVITQ